MRAAADLADECGIVAVTMRELARRLGLEAASLYNHISDKEDLLDAMADLVTAEITVHSDERGWKEALRCWAASARKVFLRHTWAAGLIESRKRTGPGRLSYVNSVLGIMLDAGFPPTVAANAILVLDSYLHGFERTRSGAPAAGGEAGGGTGGGTETAREILAGIPDGSYEAAARIATLYSETPFDREAAFDFGLGLILDGLEGLPDRVS